MIFAILTIAMSVAMLVLCWAVDKEGYERGKSES